MASSRLREDTKEESKEGEGQNKEEVRQANSAKCARHSDESTMFEVLGGLSSGHMGHLGATFGHLEAILRPS